MTAGRPEPRPFAALPRGLAPLGYRNYALYWIGFVVSNTGRWIELTGAVWLVSELTPSPILLGFLGLARAIPSLVVGPIAGVVVDRVDPRRLLFVTQLLSLLNSLVLGLLIAFGEVQLWQVYLQVAVQATITAFDAASRQTLFPRLVPRRQLADAVTLSATAGRSSSLIGPALGGLSIALWGEAAPFLLNAASFLVLMLALALMTDIPSEVRELGTTFKGELIAGIRYMAGKPVLSGLLMMELVFGIFSMNAVMITIFARDVLGVGPEGLGALLAAPAVGSLIGIGALIAHGPARWPGRFVIVCTFIYAAAMVAFALSTTFLLSFAILSVTGLMDALVSVTRHSIVQLAAPGPMRGRVMANMGTVTRGVNPLSQVQSGILAAAIGPPLAVVVAAIVLAASAGAASRFNSTLRGFRLPDATDEPRAPDARLTPPEIPVG